MPATDSTGSRRRSTRLVSISVLICLNFYSEHSANVIVSDWLGYHLYADDTRLIGYTKIYYVLYIIDRLQVQYRVTMLLNSCILRQYALYCV